MQDNALLVQQAQLYLETACPDNDRAKIAQLLDAFLQHKNGVLQGKEFAVSLQQHIWKHVLKELGCNPVRDTQHLSPGLLLSQSDVTRFMQQHGRGGEYTAACKTDAEPETLATWQDLLADTIEEAAEPGLLDDSARQGILNMILASAAGANDAGTLASSIDRLLAMQALVHELQDFPKGVAGSDTKELEIASLKERIAHLESAVAHMSKLPSMAAEESLASSPVQARQHAVQEEQADPFPFGTADGTFAHTRLPRLKKS